MTNPIQAKPVHEESTYQMLIDSEEKDRGIGEAFVYLLLFLATVTTIWQFGREPVRFADIGVMHAEKIAAVYL
ncbi:MAG TPA: hypothetical protein VGL24_03095 [Chthoniobacterales bacterium]|jgi:hypothetical protein